MPRTFITLGFAAALAYAPTASAQPIKIGLTATFTGVNSTAGMPHRQTSEIYPKSLGGVPVEWIVLDDATDPVTAVKNARKFVDDDRVDAIIGSSSSITSAPISDVANASKTLQVSLSPIPIPGDKIEWVFNIAQPLELMLAGVVEDMKAKNIKRVGFIGHSDGWGDLNLSAIKTLTDRAGIEIVATERYSRTDSSVTAQVLKLIAAEPDAVYVGGAGTAAALPHTGLVDQGFTGPIYHNHGAVAQSFIDAGGAAIEGAIMPTSPMVVANDLPTNHPSKATALDFLEKFKKRWGDLTVQPFPGYSWDAMLLLDSAAKRALEKAKPGTAEFRAALRDALQSGSEVIGTSAVYKYSPTDHNGVDERSRVMVVVKDGKFRLMQ